MITSLSAYDPHFKNGPVNKPPYLFVKIVSLVLKAPMDALIAHSVGRNTVIFSYNIIEEDFEPT